MEFFDSVFSMDKVPQDGYSQVLLLGRSNVGKSSFINAYSNRKNLAKVSKTPGKTLGLNYYFDKNNDMYLVDAPGYGYAKRDNKTRDNIFNLINEYLKKGCQSLILLFIDYKVGPTADDLSVLSYLINSNYNFIIVLTKMDKVKPSIKVKTLKNIKEKIKNLPYFEISSEKRLGISELKDYIINSIKENKNAK